MGGMGKCRWLEQFEWSETIDEEQANAGPRYSRHIVCRVTSTCVGAVGGVGRGTRIGGVLAGIETTFNLETIQQASRTDL